MEKMCYNDCAPSNHRHPHPSVTTTSNTYSTQNTITHYHSVDHHYHFASTVGLHTTQTLNATITPSYNTHPHHPITLMSSPSVAELGWGMMECPHQILDSFL
ncbi:Hypothetical predicted protein [Olea europaea subsp. europaea]|uniref:Uncharacterized protein n=1 Tax=Olea europaea subsp. europaea TaxID=158383 RepID=A0A8S0U4N0_OLEEU|nr:Hypothetical predicted protein [Olea europaea subsp. europaea]